jgi:FAD/FMN-containing dehydrogenase
MDGVQVDSENLEVAVGPGARFIDIEERLGQYGLRLLSQASGKGGTFIGWMATGGMGLGTFGHGPARDQLVSIRVMTPNGEIKDLKADDSEIGYFLLRRADGYHPQAALKVGPA